MSWITAEELAAETSTERVVRLALQAGKHAGELERVKAENERLSRALRAMWRDLEKAHDTAKTAGFPEYLTGYRTALDIVDYYRQGIANGAHW